MPWLDVALELGVEIAKIKGKKLDTKYKDKALKLRDKIWEEENKTFPERDQARIDNYKKEQADLVELFYKEIKGL